ncbi:MAG: hypothetical protein ABFD53_03465 [Anaerolineaceae bacterium]
MEILGIGPLEFILIILIALIVLGPKDMVKAGKAIGRFIRKIITSPNWHSIQRMSREWKNLPNKLMDESGLNDIEQQLGINDINKEFKEIQHNLSDWTTPPAIMEPDDIPNNNNKNETKEEAASPIDNAINPISSTPQMNDTEA